MRLSIVLPTYNERGNIAALVARIEGPLPAVPHEIVFVDDSTDGTDAVIAECARRRGSIVLIHLRRAACDDPRRSSPSLSREAAGAPADRPLLEAGSACPACGEAMIRLWCRTVCRRCGYFEGCED